MIVYRWFFLFFKMPLDVIRNELSNSILSLQPEPEIPPELPPPRPHVRCCWLVAPYRVKNRSGRVKKVSIVLCTTIIWQFLVALCYSSQSYTLTCKYANMQSCVGFSYITFNYYPSPSQWCFIHCPGVINTVQLVGIYHTSSWGGGEVKSIPILDINVVIVLVIINRQAEALLGWR